MSFIDELNQVISDLPFNKHQASRNHIAHFCEHDGICISFTRARTTWHAMAPCALKPWWLFLEPLKKKLQDRTQHQKTLKPDKDLNKNPIKNTVKNKITKTAVTTEVSENA